MQEKIQQLLKDALACQQRGDLAGAEQACRTILGLDQNQADALQFLGLIEETKGNLVEARELMEKSLAVYPNQPHVLNNLANLFHDTAESEKAIEFLKKALALQPAYWDAWFNLGKVYFDLENYDEAEPALIKARDNWHTNEPRAHTLLGSLYQNRGDFDQANQNFLKALEINPSHFNALHNYGLSLKMQQRCTEALSYYAKALALRATVPELFYNIANAHYELGDIKAAIENYKNALDLNPAFLEAHFALNEVLWRAGEKDDYVKSYREAVKKTPKSIPLRIQYLDSLLKADRFEEAESVLAETISLDPSNAKLWHIRAKVLSRRGESHKTLEALEKAIELEPETVSFRKDLSKILIQVGRPEKALRQMELAQKIAPHNQEILAYLGLCWRLLDNQKDSWLNDFEKFVRAYKIPTPPGYANLPEFNRALNRALDKFHTDKEQPSDQTLRGGTQSIAGLLDKNVKEIKEARQSFEKTISRYISELPDDPSHPLLSRKSDKFTFAGSWSIRLKDEGFHVNHTHPEGWISSSYYVSLPDQVKEGKDQQGWIKFGESPLELGVREHIGKIVQPEEGLL
ncbi:MAG: tetratricopeptide repeat protein, partial [Sphingomonadales bacterium]